MDKQKRALLVTFTPDKLPASQDLRQQFSSSYPAFADMQAVEFKCWWIDQPAGQWGAFYVFRSQEELDQYLASERWLKIVPEKYGCTPTWRVLEAGLVLSKQIITQAQGSWLGS